MRALNVWQPGWAVQPGRSWGSSERWVTCCRQHQQQDYTHDENITRRSKYTVYIYIHINTYYTIYYVYYFVFYYIILFYIILYCIICIYIYYFMFIYFILYILYYIIRYFIYYIYTSIYHFEYIHFRVIPSLIVACCQWTTQKISWNLLDNPLLVAKIYKSLVGNFQWANLIDLIKSMFIYIYVLLFFVEGDVAYTYTPYSSRLPVGYEPPFLLL